MQRFYYFVNYQKQPYYFDIQPIKERKLLLEKYKYKYANYLKYIQQFLSESH